jgi:hypothetical protein
MIHVQMPKTDKEELQWSNAMSKIWGRINEDVLIWVKMTQIIDINFIVIGEICL